MMTDPPLPIPALREFPDDLALDGDGGGYFEYLFIAAERVPPEVQEQERYESLACVRHGVRGYISAALLRHRHRDTGEPCTVLLQFLPEYKYQYCFRLREISPPDIAQSIICNVCGVHTFLREGVWPADGFWYKPMKFFGGGSDL